MTNVIVNVKNVQEIYKYVFKIKNSSCLGKIDDYTQLEHYKNKKKL